MKVWSVLGIFVAHTLAVSIAEVGAGHQQKPLKAEEAGFQWQKIEPSRHLSYTPCYDGFFCARLDVPLNWNATGKEAEDNRAQIAVIRLPAKVPVTDERYGGAILTNPGGPGESGVDELLQRGQGIQSTVDASNDDNGKYFDIISFDPRGVRQTTPSLHCFPDAFSQQVWLSDRAGYGEMYEFEDTFNLEWARTKALGQSCTAERDGVDIVPFLNTAQVVEDMVAIVEAHGEWRQREAHEEVNLLSTSLLPSNVVRSIQQRTQWHQGHEKLQYWGFSYGTIIGQTFAAMHPDRIHRMTIDGVVDPDDYYDSRFIADLNDSDKAMKKICEYCFQAGPSRCPISGESGEDIENTLVSLLDNLRHNPVPAIGPNGTPVVVSFDDFYLKSIGAMAFPFIYAERFFDEFVQLSKGNVSAVAAEKEATIDAAGALAHCRKHSNGCMREEAFGLVTGTPVIECLDSAIYRTKEFTKEDFRQYYEKLRAQSKWFSASWARHSMSCIGIDREPAWTFRGSISGNTSHPLLIIGNTHDTVTPLKSAKKASTLFPSSTVLEQNSEGHCSYAMPSTCTAKHIRRYFQTGEIPKPGTVCEPDWRPFLGSNSGLDEFALWKLEETGQKLVLPWRSNGL